MGPVDGVTNSEISRGEAAGGLPQAPSPWVKEGVRAADSDGKAIGLGDTSKETLRERESGSNPSSASSLVGRSSCITLGNTFPRRLPRRAVTAAAQLGARRGVDRREPLLSVLALGARRRDRPGPQPRAGQGG